MANCRSGTSIEKAVLSIVKRKLFGVAAVSSLHMGPRREEDWVVAYMGMRRVVQARISFWAVEMLEMGVISIGGLRDGRGMH